MGLNIESLMCIRLQCHQKSQPYHSKRQTNTLIVISTGQDPENLSNLSGGLLSDHALMVQKSEHVQDYLCLPLYVAGVHSLCGSVRLKAVRKMVSPVYYDNSYTPSRLIRYGPQYRSPKGAAQRLNIGKIWAMQKSSTTKSGVGLSKSLIINPSHLPY